MPYHLFTFDTTPTYNHLVRRLYQTLQYVPQYLDTKKDAMVAAQNGATIIVLDNFTPKQIVSTINDLKKQKLHNKIKIESSG